MATRWAYLNGQWIDDRLLSIPVSDLGFLLGVTVTERLRTFSGVPFRVEEHMRRLRRSLEIVGLPSDSIAGELHEAIRQFVGHNRPLMAEGDDWAISAFVTPGSGSGPLRVVHGFPLEFTSWAHQFGEGVPLRVSNFRQTPLNCWPPELKCRSRMHYYLADQQARQSSPGSRALLLDQEGFVGEASTANVVIYTREQGILSPRMDKVLPGVSVATTRELATQLGVPFTERDITLEEFQACDEAWLSSTSVCLLPVASCDGRKIGHACPGPVYAEFLSAWNRLVGIDIAQQALEQAKLRRAN